MSRGDRTSGLACPSNTVNSNYTAHVDIQDHILFYDGDCAMCNGFVQFVIRRDRHLRFRFAPINGETWRSLIDKEGNDPLKTIYLLDQKRLFIRTSAICRLLIELGGFWKAVGWLLWLIPRPIRNIGYRLIACCRYRVFGKVDTCSIAPTDGPTRLLP